MSATHFMRASLFSFLAILSLPASAQIVVIVSTKNPISKLTQEQVSQIFLGQLGTFISGGKAEPLDLPETSHLRAEFYTKVLGKSLPQVKGYWSKQSFSGKGQPPAILPGPSELVSKVAGNPKYIGYVDKAAVTPEVKVLAIQ